MPLAGRQGGTVADARANTVAPRGCRPVTIEKGNRFASRLGWIDTASAGALSCTVGQAVRVRGLTRRAELNGLEGHVTDDERDAQGRVRVRLDLAGGGAKDLWVSPLRLEHALLRERGPAVFAEDAPWRPHRSALSASAPALPGQSDVATAAPRAGGLELGSIPALPYLKAMPTLSTPKGPGPGREAHKISSQGRGYSRRRDGGFCYGPVL
ncbi:unnamed protein product [Prorocentrum cordatum]|uniref:RNA helicase n=1 Tax=Prorocentrum cordatum TaxID=2364126 RepID=A0ABN9TEA7_9DINO|nr:unnamed protein product [Polarella glacialis]